MRIHASVLAAVLAFASGSAASQPASPPTPPVGVMQVAKEAVTETVSFVGRIEAIDRVNLVARVTGFVQERTFREGQEVEQDDLLFVIERAPYLAAVESAKATLASAEAAKANADAQLARAEELLRTRDTSPAVRDQRKAEAEMAAASVLEAQAALTRAQINLDYTLIRAPVAGRIGRAAVSPGNVVGPETGPLALLVGQDPMYVTFPVSQRVFLDLDREARRDAEQKLRVRLRFQDGSRYDQAGQIDFVDVTVAQGTDTVTVRARIDNPDRRLIDGQFVTVAVEGPEPEQRVVIPQSAMLLDQQGAFVFLVEDGRAAIRRLRLGQPLEGGRIVVEEGLAGGEMLIVDGLQRVRPGQSVQGVPAAPRPARGG
ncbi:efflux RND transporter periplasmic adaptor subunit [Elioraea sp.]|uniref:efflux RND transporter periplasmic adaptor subunit n=1 Tax=Elioraea sp. TaxID=2185103 RepID=UPI003F7286C2